MAKSAALRTSSWLLTNRIHCLKGIGIGLLIAYFYNDAFYIDWFWVATDLGICFGICVTSAVFFVRVVNPLFERFLPSQKLDSSWNADNLINEFKRAPFRFFVLLPGEDGLFFVPLLWVGITPVTGAVAAASFAAAHYPSFPVKSCVVKFVCILGIAVIVLPHGLGSGIVAHLITDGLALVALILIDSNATAPREMPPIPDRSVRGQEVP